MVGPLKRKTAKKGRKRGGKEKGKIKRPIKSYSGQQRKMGSTKNDFSFNILGSLPTGTKYTPWLLSETCTKKNLAYLRVGKG